MHHLPFFQSVVPEQVHSQLPQERAASELSDDDYYDTAWYFANRDGQDSDRTLFGGDVRVSPRQSFTPQEREQLMELLRAVIAGEPLLDELNQQPLAKLMLQWDVASVW